jgi:ribosomal 50S subunit-recycling heat shock protein
MRIDKFLKVARIVKKRSVAKALADHEKIKLNGKFAKPSSVVEIGDSIEVIFGERVLKVKVANILYNPKKADSTTMIEVVE